MLDNNHSWVAGCTRMLTSVSENVGFPVSLFRGLWLLTDQLLFQTREAGDSAAVSDWQWFLEGDGGVSGACVWCWGCKRDRGGCGWWGVPGDHRWAAHGGLQHPSDGGDQHRLRGHPVLPHALPETVLHTAQSLQCGSDGEVTGYLVTNKLLHQFLQQLTITTINYSNNYLVQQSNRS